MTKRPGSSTLHDWITREHLDGTDLTLDAVRTLAHTPTTETSTDTHRALRAGYTLHTHTTPAAALDLEPHSDTEPTTPETTETP